MSIRSGYGPRDDNWRKLGADNKAYGIFCLVINAGRRYLISTADIDIYDEKNQDWLHFVGAILNDISYSETVDVYTMDASSTTRINIECMSEHFPLNEIRTRGYLLQDIEIDIYWYIANADHSWRNAIHLLKGKLTNPLWDEERGVSKFSVEDYRLQYSNPFPPVIAISDNLSGLYSEHEGKPYPIVIGEVKRLPVLDISNGSWDEFLVMSDILNEFGGGGLNLITGIYDGDTAPNTLAESAEGQTTDSASNRYYYVQCVGDAATTRDVTVDVEGYDGSDVGDIFRYLLMFFGDDADLFEYSSYEKLSKAFTAINLGFGINERLEHGVLGLIQERLARVLPVVMFQRGGKYRFEPVLWTRDIVKRLSFEKNILNCTTLPTETPRNNIYNSFVVNYARSCYKGDFTGSIVQDWNNNRYCQLSKKRYGPRPMNTIDAGDISNANGANWIANWNIETFSKVRVQTSYECSFDMMNVPILSNVRVFNEYEGWDHGPIFKVVGLHYGTGPTIGVDLLSVDDYFGVYGIGNLS